MRAKKRSRTSHLPCTLSRMKKILMGSEDFGVLGLQGHKTEPTLRTGVTAMSSVAIALLQK